ncbi:MAG: HIT family protein [Clostridia bacterium]|nr:HIT family protein [Clostridia bacterium]
MEDCIFCKIIKGDVPSYKIYEDEYTYAFLDIAKDVDGHTLVVPKKHVTNVLDCDNETLHHVMDTVKKISNHYTDDLGYDGVDLINANGEAAQQSVFHLHIHIIPRKKDDKVNAWPEFTGALNDIEEMHNKLKMM